MVSLTDCLDLRNCTIRFTYFKDEFEGLLLRVMPKASLIAVKAVLLPCQTKFGILHFNINRITNLEVIKRPDPPQEKDETKEEKPTKPTSELSYMELMYEKYGKTTRSSAVRTFMDDMFDLDGDSDSENEDIPDLGLEEDEYSVKLPPKLSNCLPLDSITIDSIDNDFHLAVKHIGNQDSIGVSLEGLKISRSGTLIWLCISTSYCTFLFDILMLGDNAFHSGLKLILESTNIQKVIHNCRLASDCLYHLYNIRLVNVFDTQAADSVVMMHQNKGSKVIQQVNTLNACLSYYLDVPDEYLYESLCFDENERSVNYYGRRPLRHRFQDIMIKNVMYLRLLKDKIKKAALLPLQKVTNTYLDVVRYSSNKKLQIFHPITTKLPPETLLEGVKIVRYIQHKEIQPVVVSEPSYRKLANPFKDYGNYYLKKNLENGNYYLKKNLEKQCSDSESDKNIDQISVDSSNSCKDKQMKPSSVSADSSHNSVAKICDTFQKTENERRFEAIMKQHKAYFDKQKTLNSIEPKPKEMVKECSTSKNNYQYSSEECLVKPVSNSIEVKPSSVSADSSHNSVVKISDTFQKTENERTFEAVMKRRKAYFDKQKMLNSIEPKLKKMVKECSTSKNNYQYSSEERLVKPVSNSIEVKPSSVSADSSHNSVVKISDTFQKTENERMFEAVMKRRKAYFDKQKTLNSIEPKPKEMVKECSTSKNNHQYSRERQVKPVSNSIEVNHHLDVKNSDPVLETEATLKEHLARTSKLKMFSNETKCGKVGDSLSENIQVIKLPFFHLKITSSGDQEFLEVTSRSNTHDSFVDCSHLWESIRQQIRNEDNSNEDKSKLKFIPAGMAGY